MNKTVKCPTCKNSVEWTKDSKFRPFCSKRCRLIDLGEWASETHSIPGQPLPSTEDLPFSADNESENY